MVGCIPKTVYEGRGLILPSIRDGDRSVGLTHCLLNCHLQKSFIVPAFRTSESWIDNSMGGTPKQTTTPSFMRLKLLKIPYRVTPETVFYSTHHT